jgi:hypothetical protein
LEDVLPCYQITRDRDVCSCLDQRVEPAKAIIRELEYSAIVVTANSRISLATDLSERIGV